MEKTGKKPPILQSEPLNIIPEFDYYDARGNKIHIYQAMEGYSGWEYVGVDLHECEPVYRLYDVAGRCISHSYFTYDLVRKA